MQAILNLFKVKKVYFSPLRYATTAEWIFIFFGRAQISHFPNIDVSAQKENL